MSFKAIAVAMAMTSMTAQAFGSEFFFQSKAGQSDLSARLGFMSATVKPNSITQEQKITGVTNTGFTYEYGLTEQFSVQATLRYTSVKNDVYDLKSKGLQDPTINLKGTSNLGVANLYYGLNTGLALQKAKIDGNDRSVASGGFSFTPYLGLDTEAAGGTMGVGLIYAFLLERTVEDTSATEDDKITGGNKLGISVFYETKVTDVTFGSSLNFLNQAATKDQDSNELTSNYNTWGVSAYSVIPFENYSLIPALTYEFTRSDMDKYNAAEVSVTGRFNF